MGILLALDQGTTSSRAIVFDRFGKILGSAQREFRQSFPMPGWVEHDPEEIWRTQLEVAREALKNASLEASQVVSLGITNQRETTVVWDRKTGVPVSPAIVWQDRRTSERCDTLRLEGFEETVTQKTGLTLDPYFCATKVEWILNQVPDARSKAENGDLLFGTIDTWLIWKLTGGAVHATDVTNASRTLLWNLKEGRWDDELLERFKIPISMMPEAKPSCSHFGETQKELFGSPVIIGGVAGDQQAALFGQNCSRPGLAKNTYGTGCFALMNIGSEAVMSKSRLLTTSACAENGHKAFALEGSVFCGGSAVQWLRDGLGIINSAAEVEQLALSVEDTGGVYVVPAFTGLGAPHWDSHARGTIVGITRGTTRAHLARATLEGIAFQVMDVLKAMEMDMGEPLCELRVDGGASKNDLLMQMQADFLGTPVVRSKMTEATALGAAFLAGLTSHVWTDTRELDELYQVDRVFEPTESGDTILDRKHQWTQALQRAGQWD